MSPDSSTENLLIAPKTDAETLAALKTDDRLNRARKAFSSHCGQIEQSLQQRRLPTAIELRRMEFEAVIAIAAALASKDS